MNTTVYLIRHGKIDNPNNVMYGKNIDLELSEEGKDQIRALTKKLKELGIRIEKVYTSPLKRAPETARILTSQLGLADSAVEQNLTDVDISFLRGKPMEERIEIHKSGTDEYSEKYVKLENESRDHIVNRVKDVFKKIVLKNRGKVVAIVSHGDPIQFLLYALSNPEEEVSSMNILINKNYPPKGSATRLIVDDQMQILNRELI